jgi:hypothetical protein
VVVAEGIRVDSWAGLSLVSSIRWCNTVVPLGGAAGTVSWGAVLVVLVTDAGGACGNVWVDADFHLFVQRRHGTGKGGSLLGDGFFCSAGFAFLCSFKGGRGVLLRFFFYRAE